VVGRDGRVRVVDFGVARVATSAPSGGPTAGKPDSSGVPDMTQPGSLVGTPAYMSPEQLRGQAADPRSDQFSFCVSLYEALHGARPFAGASVDGLLAAIEAGQVAAAVRPEVPRWLERTVRRGLSADPARRFPSMAALLAELDRERGRVRRRALVAAGLLAVGAAGALAAARAGTRDTCTDAAAAITAIWNPDVAARTRSRFTAVANSFGEGAYRDVAGVLDERAARWRALRVAACRDRDAGGDAAAARFDRQVACLERHRQEFASAVELIVHADRAAVENTRQMARQSFLLADCTGNEALARAAAPTDPQARARRADLQARIANLELLRWAGKFELAIAEAKSVLAATRALGDAPLVTEAKLALGMLHSRVHRPEDAEPLLSEAMSEAIAAGQQTLAARAATELFAVAVDLGHYEAAETHALHARAAIRAIGGERDLEAFLARSFGEMRLMQGHDAEAIGHHLAAMALYGGPPADLTMVGGSLTNIGMAQSNLHHYDEAQRLLELAAVTIERSGGAGHPSLGTVATQLGIAAQGRGDLETAEAHFRHAIDLETAAYGPKSEPALTARFSLAVLRDKQDRAEAEAELEAVLADQEAALGPRDPGAPRTLNSLALMADRRGDKTRAIAYAKRSVELYEAIYGRDHRKVANSRTMLAQLLGEAGQHAEAMKAFEAALPRWRAIYGDVHPRVAAAQTGLGIEAEALGDLPRAIVELEGALVLWDKLGVISANRAATEFALAKALWRDGRQRRRAGELFRAARAHVESDQSATAEIEAWMTAHGVQSR
jgi:tetratricopeptide (TPR) repeat protein